MPELVASLSVEEQFNRVVHCIEQRLRLLDRLPRVRINAWIKKLRDEVSGNVTWQRNRNAYARLLLEQLRAGCLEVPFNTMPPEGGLPTLPPYLMYRFVSPPKQPRGEYASTGLFDAEPSSSSACLAGCGSAGLSRPRSAGAAAASSPTLRQLPAAGAHDSWRVVWGDSSPSSSSARNTSQQQQPWHSASPKAMHRSTCSSQRGYVSSSCKGSPQQQRPRSPGAAGLLDAAAAVAAELEAEREEASRISCRLRFAEDKILQQEAELVQLQGAASSARRRIKSATAATLQEMLERYGSAAAAWAGAGGSPTGSSGPALADGVYRPVWQLLSGLQSVLDSCDQQEQEWVRAKGQAAAAALEAAYEAHEAAAAAGGVGGGSGLPWSSSPVACADSTQAGTHSKAPGAQQQGKGATAHFASEAAAAAAAEGAVLKHCEQCLQGLQQTAEQLAADLAVKKEEATAAAGGRGSASTVAEGAAKLLKPMLKALRREGKDAHKLRRRLEAAAEATDAAAASATAIAGSAAQSVLELQKSLLSRADSGTSSSKASSSSSSSSSSSNSDDDADSDIDGTSGGGGSRRSRARRQLKQEQRVLAASEQQQQQQGARLQRLQSASQVLMELDKAAGKLETVMQEAQQRLQDMAAAGGGASAAGSHHDNGLVAAGTAGLAASLSAGVRAFHATANNLGHLIQSLREVAAAAAAADAGRASEAGRSTAAGSTQQQQQRHPRGSSVFSTPLSTPRGEHLSATSAGGGGVSASKLLSSRLGDAALAGTWGATDAAAAAAASAGGGASQLLSPWAGSDLLQPHSTGGGAYDEASHYLIGAAAAATAGRSTAGGSSISRGGVALSVSPQAAAAASEGWRVLRSAPSSPRGLSLGSKVAFAEQLQGVTAAAAGTGGAPLSGLSSGGVSGGASPRGGDAAAEAVHAVHAQLAGLSRQASRLSLKANAILAAGGGRGSDAVDVSSAGAVRVPLSGSSSLAGSLRQREGVTGTASPFSTAPASPRGLSGLDALSPRAAGIAGLGGLGGLGSAFGSTGNPPVPGSPRSGSLLSSATRSLLLSGQSGRGLGSAPSAGVGALGTRPALNLTSSFSGPLLRGGGFTGGLGGGSSSSLGGLGGGVGLLRSAGAGLGKPYAAGVPAVPGVGLGSSSSLAAISSRLQSLANGGR